MALAWAALALACRHMGMGTTRREPHLAMDSACRATSIGIAARVRVCPLCGRAGRGCYSELCVL